MCLQTDSTVAKPRFGLALRALLLAFSVLAALGVGIPHAHAVCLATGKACGVSAPANDRLCCPGTICGWGNVCQAGCRINGTLYQNQARNPSNACQVCQPSSSTTAWTNRAAGTTCNDANACTTGETCSGGTCGGGAAVNCNDTNVCTTDSCNPATGCAHANNTNACDDSTVCNGREVCGGGSCNRLAAPNCDDGNECTNDTCDPVAGCQYESNTNTCNNNTQLCSGGACQPCLPACVAPQTCGGGGVPGVCGCTDDGTACDGRNCGTFLGNCNDSFHCGSCSLPETCGGQGTPGVCEIPPDCTNLCLQQVTCPTVGATTSVKGTVLAPNGGEPLNNAFVYVPNSAVTPFTAGVACDSCGAPVSGSPLVSAVTGVDGKFTLTNVPVGSNIPLVIQIGRWRRQVIIPTVPQCVTTTLATNLTRMPRNKTEGDIPLMAFATGSADAIECVLRKIGIADSEFTAASGTGRIHLYRGLDDAASGARGGAGFGGGAPENVLWTTVAQLNKYDLVFLPCQGDDAVRSAAVLQNLIDYADNGGQVFATHYSHAWLAHRAPFTGTADWSIDLPNLANQTAFVNTSFPKGLALAQWLQQVGASVTPGQIPLTDLRQDIANDGINSPSQLWLSLPLTGGHYISMQYSFDTPVGDPPADQCGRVLFEDSHFDAAGSYGTIFPAACVAGALTPQEKLLEFMIFDQKTCTAP